MPIQPQSPLDAFDLAILKQLQQDNTTALRVIGDTVNLSTAAVQRRIKRMQQNGAISANTAVVNPEATGKPITILVEVHAERTHIEDLDVLKAQMSVPAVQQCYYVTGDADFMLVVVVETMKAYETLARQLFYENRNIKWFRSIVVMDRVKVSLDVPLG
ncbi:Lrp/AsnC family transcriptional regulator [Pseudomonas sp. 15FMM2]|uniref:Lrp/AsnC family transcriptional regulator n=1 Tax=Pseudomonas imrae TaxID=2992837 RepID=A0ACC7PF40_9PSED